MSADSRASSSLLPQCRIEDLHQTNQELRAEVQRELSVSAVCALYRVQCLCVVRCGGLLGACCRQHRGWVCSACLYDAHMSDLDSVSYPALIIPFHLTHHPHLPLPPRPRPLPSPPLPARTQTAATIGDSPGGDDLTQRHGQVQRRVHRGQSCTSPPLPSPPLPSLPPLASHHSRPLPSFPPSPLLPSLHSRPLPSPHSPPTDTTCLQSCGLRLPIPGEEEEEEQLKGRRMDSAEREELLKEVRVPACVLECVHTNIDRRVNVSSDVEHFT